jgi:hypothetical protein
MYFYKNVLGIQFLLASVVFYIFTHKRSKSMYPHVQHFPVVIFILLLSFLIKFINDGASCT